MRAWGKLAGVLLVVMGCLALAAVAAGRTGATPGRAAENPSSVEDSIRDCANRQRQARGMRTLEQDRTLDRAARLHARHMLAQGFFDHKDPSGDGPADRVKRFAKRRYVIIGENIAAGYESSGAACRGWMNSAGHRANILRSSFTRVGGGYAEGSRHYGRYYVQVFADVP
jgi:uncharacterized protein YkwD